MFYGFGRGFGFRGASPPWPYVGRGRGGLPRCWYPQSVMAPPYAPASYGGYSARGIRPYSPQMTPERELDFLKEEANAIRKRLEEIETRIQQLGSET